MSNVVVLQPLERNGEDIERLLYCSARAAREGRAAAMDEMLEGLAERMSGVSRAYRAGKTLSLAILAQDLGERAYELGLNRMFRLARVVVEQAEAGGSVTLGATVARLIRLGDGALAAAWEQQDERF